MTTTVNRAFLVGALLICVALVGAQTGNGGNGGGGGRGAGRQGRGGFGQQGRNGAGSELTLALRKDVQADLVVTDDQKTKLTDLQQKQRDARRAAGGGQRGAGGAGGGQVDPAERQKRAEEQRAQTHKDLAAILNDGQMKRLGEISIQLRGNRAILDPEVQKTLGLSSDQTAKIKDLQDKQTEANRSVFEKVRNQEISQDDARKSMETNTKAMDTELAKILTSDQAAKLKDLGGKPFKADPAESQPGGRRGGGGGGGL